MTAHRDLPILPSRTLHLQDTTDLEQMLSFLLFGDGCAACIVSADPVGVALDSFYAVLVPSTRGLITWNIREAGFDMVCWRRTRERDQTAPTQASSQNVSPQSKS